MDINSDLITPIAAVGGTGVSMLWLTRVMVSNWLDKHSKLEEVVRQCDKQLAVVLSRLEGIDRDLNGLGNSLRQKLTPLNKEGCQPP